jgi:cysteine desulfurase/selenocysteine lyase
MEHHANLVPWLMLREEKGVELRFVPVDDDGYLVFSDLERLVDGVSLVAVTAMSNVLGTLTPVRYIADMAHQAGAVVVVDGAQYVPHLATDVQALGADFFAFTGHKMLGPTGIGVLWGRLPLLQELPPFLGGGEMIEVVTMEKSTFAQPPHKFEAGTPPIAEAVALGAAVDYLTAVGMPAIAAHEHELTAYVLNALSSVEGVKIIGPASPEGRVAEVSFTLAGVHPHDVGQVLDELGIAVRVGHHCARPAVVHYGIPATTRASFYLYNTTAEADALVAGLAQVKKVFG